MRDGSLNNEISLPTHVCMFKGKSVKQLRRAVCNVANPPRRQRIQKEER